MSTHQLFCFLGFEKHGHIVALVMKKVESNPTGPVIHDGSGRVHIHHENGIRSRVDVRKSNNSLPEQSMTVVHGRHVGEY
jgi:hypothetical protein